MKRGPLLLLFALATSCLLIFLLKTQPLGHSSTELALHGLTAERDAAGRIVEISLAGSGFDSHTRLLLTPDFGNRRALLQTIPTWGNLQSVTIDGDLVYLANNYRGMQILDFSDPDRPRQIGSVPLPDIALSIAVSDNIACVATREEGLHIVDIADPQHPALSAAVHLGGKAVDVVIDGNLAYVANSKAGLQVVDLTAPKNPKLLATLTLPGQSHSLIVDKGIVYLAAAKGGLQIVDARNPRKLSRLGGLQTPGPAFDLVLRNGMVHIAAGRAGLISIDVRIPQAPRVVSAVDTPGTSRGIALAGEQVYLADNMDGLQVIDVADPRHPFLVGAYDFPGMALSVELKGDRAFVSTGRTGLQIINLRQPATPLRAEISLHARKTDEKKENRVYLVDMTGITAIDLGAFPEPVVSSIPTDGLVRSFQVAGDFLYVLLDQKIEIFDIRDLEHPLPVNCLEPSHRPLDLLIVGKNLWTVSPDGLCRFDLADPPFPRLQGCLPLPGVCESLAWKDDLIVTGDRNGALYVIDTKEAETPRLIGSADLPWHLQAFAATEKVIVQDSLALVAGGRNGLLIYSIANPKEPQLIGGMQLPDGNNAGGMAINGQTAYIKDIRRGLHLIDFSNPRQPQLLATIGNQGKSRQFVITGKQIIFASQEEVCAFPQPMELTDIVVASSSRLTARIADPISSGSYTLWAVNGHRRAEIPGALVAGPP